MQIYHIKVTGEDNAQIPLHLSCSKPA